MKGRSFAAKVRSSIKRMSVISFTAHTLAIPAFKSFMYMYCPIDTLTKRHIPIIDRAICQSRTVNVTESTITELITRPLKDNEP